jgi:type IV fimbrial biogenesis protein FimT
MKAKGFTLVELSMVIAIAGILCFGAIPGLADLAARQESKNTSTSVLRSIAFAREYAIYNQTYTSICPSHDGTACEAGWGSYLIVFKDESGSGKLHSEEDILSVAHLDGGWQARWKAFGGKPQLTLTARGFTKHQNGSFYLCPNKPNVGPRKVVVNKAGRGRISTGEDKKISC